MVIIRQFRSTVFCCCCRCGHMGNALALSCVHSDVVLSHRRVRDQALTGLVPIRPHVARNNASGAHSRVNWRDRVRSMDNNIFDAKALRVRIEIRSGVGRRRRWAKKRKAGSSRKQLPRGGGCGRCAPVRSGGPALMELDQGCKSRSPGAAFLVRSGISYAANDLLWIIAHLTGRE